MFLSPTYLQEFYQTCTFLECKIISVIPYNIAVHSRCLLYVSHKNE